MVSRVLLRDYCLRWCVFVFKDLCLFMWEIFFEWYGRKFILSLRFAILALTSFK